MARKNYVYKKKDLLEMRNQKLRSVLKRKTSLKDEEIEREIANINMSRVKSECIHILTFCEMVGKTLKEMIQYCLEQEMFAVFNTHDGWYLHEKHLKNFNILKTAKEL